MKLTNAFVYIMTNINRTTFYIGVTNDLERRVKEHKSGEGSEFTSQYKLFVLVYYEKISDIKTAIKREKQLKRWHRQWKLNLIKELNPNFDDLAEDWE
ncbi:MAG TPA: GIY-YIG nuclease family protein [Bacteroidia bacterium]|jgi:putative endonuclease|nr:GIY-YIG nuclease family protein [Bacteroidia bacterium]